MVDLPQEPAVVHECIVEIKRKVTEQECLEITDLSFYNVLAGGMCSGSSSSGPVDKIQGSDRTEEQV